MSNAMIGIASATNSAGAIASAFVTGDGTEWWLGGIVLCLAAIGIRFGGRERASSGVAALALFIPSFAQLWAIDARFAGVVLALAGIVHSFMTALRAWVILSGYLVAIIAVFAASGSRSPQPGNELMTFVVLVGVVAAVATLGITYRSNWQTTARRFRETVRLAPVGIIQYDVSGLGPIIVQLTGAGVTDLATHIEDDPRVIDRASAALLVVGANPAARAVVEAPSMGEMLHVARWNEQIEITEHLLEAALAGRSDFEFETTALSIRGAKVDLYVRGVLLTDAGQTTPSRAIVTTVDLGSQKAAERALAAQIEARDRFLASVSHELRTPLSVVLGLTQELSDRWETIPADERASLLEMAVSQSREMAHLIEDLLVAARLDQSSQHVTRERVDLAEVTTEVVDVLGIHPAELQLSAGLIASADAIRVRQVLRNLLMNALKYGGPKIVIRGVRSAGVVAVEIADDGPEIDPEVEAHMFDPYASGNRQHGLTESVGLGLFVSRELAALMNGSLHYARVGGMTVFTLTLPAIGTAPATTQPAQVDVDVR